MRIANTTALAARVTAASVFGIRGRVGMIVAKATFAFDPRGRVTLETQSPQPVFDRDETTPHGTFASDDQPWHDEAFEVFVFGSAYARGARPVRAMRVGMSVGEVRRELLVVGDRHWTHAWGRAPHISSPEPFERMPLTWDRAFGGTCEVHVDRGAALTVSHPDNPRGRGFDPAPTAEATARMLRAPAGYPQFDRTRRLPNVEDPRAPIVAWDDAPEPKCWATLPFDTAMYGLRAMRAEPTAGGHAMIQPGASHRAHPDWIIARPEAASEVVLDGLSLEGRVTFQLPTMRVFADYAFGERRGTFELTPHALALVADARVFHIVYRHTFAFDCGARDVRALRLRTAPGWIATEPREVCA